jgi:putative membrane protein
MSFLIRLLINAIALLIISQLHFMGIHADTIMALIIGALILGLANAIVRPILIVVSCPLEVLSLGLFTLVINAIVFYFALKYIPGFHIPGFWAAFWGAILMSIISWIISLLVRDVSPEQKRFSP